MRQKCKVFMWLSEKSCMYSYLLYKRRKTTTHSRDEREKKAVPIFFVLSNAKNHEKISIYKFIKRFSIHNATMFDPSETDSKLTFFSKLNLFFVNFVLSFFSYRM